MTRTTLYSLRSVLAALAVAAAVPLSSCNEPAGAHDESAYGLPELPATLPLAVGEASMPVFAPAAAELPFVEPIGLGRIADPDDYYAYADDAWGYSDALGDAPPDYGFEYDDVEPWAWQGYDDSMMFVEPLDYGYRYYYYRPGDDYPYFVRDPDCGYGYHDGRLAVIYGSNGRVIHYSAYDTYLPYASAYYYRGHRLWNASRQRHPVIAANWEYRRHGIYNLHSHWSQERSRHRGWQAYHNRVSDRQDRYWQDERGRRLADRVRYATWREQEFRTPAPPRAIPARWTRADWARDERRYAPPARGFTGDREDRQRAVRQERVRLASLNRERTEELRDRRAERVQRQAERVRPAVLRAERIDARQDNVRRQAQLRREQQATQRERAQAQRQAQVAERRQPQVRERQQQDRAERQRAQAEQRRQAQEATQRDQRQSQARAEAQQRREAQARERAQAQERRQAQARERTEASARQQAQARERQQAEDRHQQQAQARQEAQQRRAQADERRQAQAREQSEARQRQQAQREQAQARTQQREAAQQRRQEAAQARQQPAERPARVAAASTDRAEARQEARAERQKIRAERREARDK